jgi:aminoglycoside 6'-N-acetyltransferase I
MKQHPPCSIERISLDDDRMFAAYCRLRIALWPDCVEDCIPEASKIVSESHDGAAFLALTAADEPIGFIEVSLRTCAEGAASSPVPFIEGWFVESTHRHQGVGRALVAMAERWAAARGFREIGSDTQSENIGSIAAHIRLGYREVERNVCFLKQIEP